jgi:hypothetical protein
MTGRMKDIASNGYETDPMDDNEKREKEIERLKPNGEQDRIDREEARIADEPDEDDEESQDNES